MGGEGTECMALMAIHPRFAEAIMAEEKTVEFSKQRLAPDLRAVLIYATAPASTAVGIFTIDQAFAASRDSVWREFGGAGPSTMTHS